MCWTRIKNKEECCFCWVPVAQCNERHTVGMCPWQDYMHPPGILKRLLSMNSFQKRALLFLTCNTATFHHCPNSATALALPNHASPLNPSLIPGTAISSANCKQQAVIPPSSECCWSTIPALPLWISSPTMHPVTVSHALFNSVPKMNKKGKLLSS